MLNSFLPSDPVRKLDTPLIIYWFPPTFVFHCGKNTYTTLSLLLWLSLFHCSSLCAQLPTSSIVPLSRVWKTEEGEREREREHGEPQETENKNWKLETVVLRVNERNLGAVCPFTDRNEGTTSIQTSLSHIYAPAVSPHLFPSEAPVNCLAVALNYLQAWRCQPWGLLRQHNQGFSILQSLVFFPLSPFISPSTAHHGTQIQRPRPHLLITTRPRSALNHRWVL